MFMRRAVVVLSLALGCARSPAPPLAPPPRSGPSLTAGPTPFVEPPPPPRADGRLPSDVRPTRYALDLTIDPAQSTFAGRARIAVTIDHPTRAIVMHGRTLNIEHAALTSAGSTLTVPAHA